MYFKSGFHNHLLVRWRFPKNIIAINRSGNSNDSLRTTKEGYSLLFEINKFPTGIPRLFSSRELFFS